MSYNFIKYALLYYGQEVLSINGDENITQLNYTTLGQINTNSKLSLSIIDNITDEDLWSMLSCLSIHDTRYIFGSTDEYFKSLTDFPEETKASKLEFINLFKDDNNSKYLETFPHVIHKIYDLLISKGYAVPYGKYDLKYIQEKWMLKNITVLSETK